MNDAQDNLPVDIGTQVEVELESESGETDRLIFTVVSDEQADFKAGFLGAHTPLATAIMGQRAGRTLPYRAGDIRRVKILSVHLSGKVQTEDVTARREAVIRKAVKRSDYINMVTFASSFDSKWGDYDIDKIDPSEWGLDDQADAEKES